MQTVESELIEKQIGAERDLIACLITNADEARSKLAWFNGGSFMDTNLGAIWDSVLAGADPVYTLYQGDANRATEILARSNDLPYNTQLSALVQVVQDCNVLRNIGTRAQDILRKIVDFDVAGAQAAIDDISAIDISYGNAPGQTIEQAGDHFKQRIRKANLSVRTGIERLDSAIGGLFGGELTIIASRPAVGKTSLAMANGRRIARERKVDFFSLEMSADQLIARMACPIAGINWTDVRLGKATPEQLDLIDAATDQVVMEMRRTNMVIIDDAYTVSDIHRAVIKTKPDVVFIDLLGKLYWPGNLKEVEWYGRAAEYLRERIAKEMDIPVVLIHHINRSPDARQDKRPALSDLRNSGDLEGVADVVWLLYREDVYNGRSPGQFNVPMEVNIAKNRQGLDCQKIILDYDLRKQDFD